MDLGFITLFDEIFENIAWVVYTRAFLLILMKVLRY